MICLPKLNGDHTPEGYRPISLLTTEYKILARILANRLRHFLAGELQHMQYCGVPGLSILDAVAKVRDILAHHETTGTPLCILTLDFHNAFDRISHAYLFRTLRAYGISEWFIERIQALYTNATASVQINGTLTGPISIQSGVRQGCPLSMILYAACLHPFLHSMTDILPPLRIGQRMRYIPVLAYADDVTIFVTQPAAFTDIQQAIQRYERATGALLNTRK